MAATIADALTLLANNKAAIKQAIIDKGVAVSDNDALSTYADKIESIETGGGGGDAPYIVNPFNGDDFGENANGIYTHLYVVSGETISEAYLTEITPLGYYDLVLDFTNSAQKTNIARRGYGTNPTVLLTVSDTGLLTLTLNKTNNRAWIPTDYIGVVITLSNGISLFDRLRPYCGWTCFIKDTKITLSDTSFKNIQDITYDDKLLVWNFDNGVYDSAKPLWIKKVQTTTWYYKLTFSDGTVLKVTGDYPKAHSLYSVDDGKFIHANELVGKEVWTLGGIKVLEDCEEIHEEVEFYNIITDYHMNLFANGVLTSTSLNNLYPIKNMRFIKEDREPVFDTSVFEDKWVKGLRLNEQPNDVTDYVNNVIKLNNNTI